MASIQIFVSLFSVGAAAAPPANCQMGTDLAQNATRHKCQIVGHSQTGSSKTYYASCTNGADEKQVEYKDGDKQAAIVDPASREEVAKCAVDAKQMQALISDYQTHADEIENPKCYLTQWKGQMMFFANGVKGRCSFNMNKNKSEEFHSKTGVTPLYQCENEYFLSMGEKTAAQVYKKSKTGWELACRATIKIGEPVENIDWKNPPQYWSPEADALGPSAGPAVNTASTQF